MKKICIIGRGRWAQRLVKWLSLHYEATVDLLDSRTEIIDVSIYPVVFICIPASCTAEVLARVVWGNEPKEVMSCVKGLMANGQTVTQYLKDNLTVALSGPIGFLGGANIDDGFEVVEMEKNNQAVNKLELACVLKNVYAIGFGMALKQGENLAAHKLSQYLSELKTLGIEEKYWADLLVSCYSDKSRNKSFGKSFSQAEVVSEKTVEGLNTARIIEKYNLFSELRELRLITKSISNFG